tara:strand:- start:1025 stop:1396 length:372 start_codon:yes stop_codon:yes gene_type:complete
MAFKLRSGNTPIFRKELRGGVKAEANNDGSIYIDSNIPAGSEEFKRTIRHEMKHMEDMESGKANYGENWVSWNGDVFFRKEIDGEMYIDGPAGRLPEGHKDHPWEAEAIQAENNTENDDEYGI